MKTLCAATGKVFRRPGYVAVAILAAAALFLLAVWLPNLELITNIVGSPIFSLSEKAGILLASIAAFGTNFTPLSRMLTVTLALLFGIDVAFLAFYMKTRLSIERAAGIGTLGIIFGLLGVGCASCGTLVISAILGAGATAGWLNLLPLKGQEFGFLGVILMVIGIVLTARKIEQPYACKIPGRRE